MNTNTNKLLDLLKSAEEKNKVLNVTNMNDNIIGYRIINKPGPNSKLKSVPGIAIVSDNYPAFKQAMDILGKEYSKYATVYQNTYGVSTVKSPKVMTPKVMTPKVNNKSVEKQYIPGLTGISEIDYKILMDMDYKSLKNVEVNKSIQKILDNDFWCQWIKIHLRRDIKTYGDCKFIAKEIHWTSDYETSETWDILLKDNHFGFIKFALDIGLITKNNIKWALIDAAQKNNENVIIYLLPMAYISDIVEPLVITIKNKNNDLIYKILNNWESNLLPEHYKYIIETAVSVKNKNLIKYLIKNNPKKVYESDIISYAIQFRIPWLITMIFNNSTINNLIFEIGNQYQHYLLNIAMSYKNYNLARKVLDKINIYSPKDLTILNNFINKKQYRDALTYLQNIERI